MSTQLTTTSNSGFLAAADADYNLLAELAGELGGGGGVFLKFNGNDGLFTYGATGDELTLGSQLAFNGMSLERGWICWKDEEVVGEEMVSFLTGRPKDKSQLPDNGPYESNQDGWQEQMAVTFKMTEAPFHELIFKATGVTKLNAIKRLVQDYVKSMKANPGLIPIVEIDETEFESKAKGARGARKHAPVFKIVAWVTEDQLLEAEQGAADEYEQPAAAPEPVKAPAKLEAPKTTTRRAAPAPAPEPEPEVQDDAEGYEDEAAPEPAPAPSPRQTAARRGRF
ncbi:polyribonucleotide nucleotidyltransferase [Caulobacter phage C1]|nr:polyribonucleotide nucleotidyltransferase [Caulobacter phage C1]UTU08409.1 polyribonucleotide nucleotidyltransferase [Caulobacter phage C2]UTU08926.1 polyribonucleotide nucleotidyltransferase [Caulobacter phage J4]UTU09482.1 polyribonucleotide nucleotidyltransferase [Caulobacter phage BL47]UTU10042.1 polyribonucleotide nucleotidyltransferase [Caulobacter phage RB23]WGN97077.1 polyribonucleotide nucleotidyltrnasferase [Bertelyvirus sp.]